MARQSAVLDGAAGAGFVPQSGRPRAHRRKSHAGRAEDGWSRRRRDRAAEDPRSARLPCHQPRRRGGHAAQSCAHRAPLYHARRHRRVWGGRRPTFRGRLQEDLDPPGFAALAALGAGDAGGGNRGTPAAPPKLQLVRSTPHPKLAEAKGRATEAEAEAARAQDAAAAAADAERRARMGAEQARSRLADVERALKSAKAEAEAAAAALKTRQAEARSAAAAATAAVKALEKARDSVDRLDRSSETDTWQR